MKLSILTILAATVSMTLAAPKKDDLPFNNSILPLPTLPPVTTPGGTTGGTTGGSTTGGGQKICPSQVFSQAQCCGVNLLGAAALDCTTGKLAGHCQSSQFLTYIQFLDHLKLQTI